MAKKKPGQKGYKRSPESIAKQKATLAKRKRRKKRAMAAAAEDTGGKLERAPRSARVVTTSASSLGIEALLESMVRRIVASELKRVLSQGID